jgi:lipoprotein-anchoring transpeptidase ErfK/SrfK
MGLLMSELITRRDFLKMGGLALGSLAFRPVFSRWSGRDWGKLARVATKQVDVRLQPNDESVIVGNRFRDQLIHIYDEVRPVNAPRYYNTLWYRVWGGYVHSGHLQIVRVRLNEPKAWMPERGTLCEVTVPYTRAYQYNRHQGWIPWRGALLYYSSTHWVTGVEEGPDGRGWYQVTSELSKMEKYLVPGEHLRIIRPEEYAPIATNVPAEKKRIEISLNEQTLRAYEYDQLVMEKKISSGIPNPRLSEEELPTATPEGRFNIYAKLPSKHMGSVAGGEEVEEAGGFTLPGVPWTCFFKTPGGYALHGTYWHENFGLQMSHGCVNMRNEDALWLFRWTTPVFDPTEVESSRDWERTGNGTSVRIFE